MKSTLIQDTTKEERIALIREWIPIEDGLEDCDIDLWICIVIISMEKRKLRKLMQNFKQILDNRRVEYVD